MGIKQIKVDVNEVTIGMFISSLDRPWTQTPFPIQGFYVRDLDEIKQLKVHCAHVFIDLIKGSAPTKPNLKTLEPKAKKARTAVLNGLEPPAKMAPIKVKTGVYNAQHEPLNKEVVRAQELHQKVFGAVGEVMSQLGGGRLVSMHETKRAAGEMVDSVLRNPDAFTWLSRVRETDEYTYGHAVRSAVWSILFGRHIGLARSELGMLALGVLIKDVGKTSLPKELLTNSNRNTQEQAEFETFVEKSVSILRKLPGVEPRVIAVVKTHRERINGSGFPQHLRGDKIPLLGKIAGIVTFYDEVINPRGAEYPVSPSQAVARLYEVRGVEFQEDLVVEFIRAIGLYPTGTLVELTTGEVDVVVEQNFERRLKPNVMLVLNALKQEHKKPYMIDLAEDDKRKQVLVDSGKKTLDEVEKIEIAQDLEPGSYEIDINKIRDDYVLKSAKKSLFSFFKKDK